MYIELHSASAFSFLDGASLPEELVGRAAELGYQALAVTDHNGLHGAMEFARAARAAEIVPITGAELTLSDDSHLTLLAETVAGYANLSAYLGLDFPHDPRRTPPTDAFLRRVLDEVERERNRYLERLRVFEHKRSLAKSHGNRQH